MNFKVTGSFLEAVDDTWQGRGFNSRSEFIRYTLRDAVEFPTFDRDELVALLEAEEDIREEWTMTADEARERFGTTGEDGRMNVGTRFEGTGRLAALSPADQDRIPDKLDEIVDSP